MSETRIPLVRNDKVVAHAVVDKDDAPSLDQRTWRLSRDGYAIRGSTAMHREIMGVVGKRNAVHHVNGDKLDNRRANLRVYENNGAHLAAEWNEHQRRRLQRLGVIE